MSRVREGEGIHFLSPFPFWERPENETMKTTLALLLAVASIASADTVSDWANDSTLVQLQVVKGIGPKLAAKIVEGRPYESIKDVDAVKGIRSKTLEKIVAQVELEEAEK